MTPLLYRTTLTVAYLVAAFLWAAAGMRVMPSAAAAQALHTIYYRFVIDGRPVVCSEQVAEAPATPSPGVAQAAALGLPHQAKPVVAVRADRNRATNAETLRLNREELTRLGARVSALQNDRNFATHH